ncbi:MAG: PhzF family phenazine biosynthesis protein [Myxococcales bacterium]
MKRPVFVVDVFTEEPLAGNAAGVLLDAEALDAPTLQRIAAEMKHAETAFPLSPRDPSTAFYLRWFTPAMEVTFCGHATVAALAVLAGEAGRLPIPAKGVHRTAFTCKAGRLQAELSRDGRGGRGGLRIQVQTPFAAFAQERISGALISSLGLVPEVLDPGRPPLRTAPGIASSVGTSNLFLCLRDRSALARARPDFPRLAAICREMSVGGTVLYVPSPAPGVDGAMRCVFPVDAGGEEDPVGGSAAGQFVTLLHEAQAGGLPRRFLFTQGDELGRPGRVEVELRPADGEGQVRAWIGGGATVVLRGELDLGG